MDPVIARTTWRTLGPIHRMIDLVPEGPEHYCNAGLFDPAG